CLDGEGVLVGEPWHARIAHLLLPSGDPVPRLIELRREVPELLDTTLRRAEELVLIEGCLLLDRLVSAHSGAAAGGKGERCEQERDDEKLHGQPASAAT